MSVVPEVEKLIVPLGHDPYCIFHECTDDEEPSGCWYVPTASKSSSQRDDSSSIPGTCTLQYIAPLPLGWHSQDNSLFYRVRRGIQPFLDLVRLLPELFEWTWIICCVCPARSPKSIVLRTEVIARRAPYLSHGRCSCEGKGATGKYVSTVDGGHGLHSAFDKGCRSNEC